LKKIDDSVWIHVFCSLWLNSSNHPYINNPRTLSDKLHEDIIGNDQIYSCLICKEKVKKSLLVKCSTTECDKRYHSICMREACYFFEFINLKDDQFLIANSYCDEHSKIQISFQINNNI